MDGLNEYRAALPQTAIEGFNKQFRFLMLKCHVLWRVGRYFEARLQKHLHLPDFMYHSIIIDKPPLDFGFKL
jgi:hypothetical protein